MICLLDSKCSIKVWTSKTFAKMHLSYSEARINLEQPEFSVVLECHVFSLSMSGYERQPATFNTVAPPRYVVGFYFPWTSSICNRSTYIYIHLIYSKIPGSPRENGANLANYELEISTKSRENWAVFTNYRTGAPRLAPTALGSRHAAPGNPHRTRPWRNGAQTLPRHRPWPGPPPSFERLPMKHELQKLI